MDEFELPETLTDLADADLAALEAQAIEAFDAVSADLAGEDALTNLGLLADAIDLLRAEAGRRIEEAEVAALAAAELAQRVHGTAEVAEADDAEQEAPAEEPAEGDAAAAPDVEVVVNAEQPIDAQPVLAAGRRGRISVDLAAVRRHAPAVEVENANTLTITAASDLPGIVSGSRLNSLEDVAQALHGRARNLADGGSSVVASIELPTRPGTHIGANATQEETNAAIDTAAAPASLTAAGGWCAPSQFLYDFFSIESADGLLSLPTVTIDRGGIQVATSPSIADVFSVPWAWTETQDIAALTTGTKPCYRIPCPGFTEYRLGAHGICLTHGNLSDRAYPENTRRYIDLVLAAHAHLMSQRHITALLAMQTAVTIAATSGVAAAAPLLAAVELQVLDYRSKFRMSDNATLEAVFPSWIKGVIRADLSRRNGSNNADAFGVTDSQIDAWFALRGVRAQFVADWQVLSNTGGTGDGFVEVWPATVIFMLYAAGTYVLGTGGSIDLGVVRDSTLNATNDFTAAWTEEFDLVAKRGHEGRKVTVTICPSGNTGAQVAVTCPVA